MELPSFWLNWVEGAILLELPVGFKNLICIYRGKNKDEVFKGYGLNNWWEPITLVSSVRIDTAHTTGLILKSDKFVGRT